MIEKSFVEVLMKFYTPGDTEFQDWLEIVDCTVPHWESATQEIPGTQKGCKNCLVTAPFASFTFRYFGQLVGFFDYASGLEWEARELGADEAFGNWLDDLGKMGRAIYDDKMAQGFKPEEVGFVRFITLWEYTTFKDSYSGEFDSEWQLLGLVNPYAVEAEK